MCKRNKFRLRSIAVLVSASILAYLYFPWAFNEQRPDVYDFQREKCHDYSPAFPSAGGPGCKTKCEPKDGQKTSGYTVIYLNNTHRWPKDFLDNMHYAGSILKKYGTPLSLDSERPVYLHVTFDYYCCYTEKEAADIGRFLNSYRWTPETISFDRMVCAIHTHGDKVSLVLMADQDSQTKLLRLALETEQELEKETRIPKHIPHSQLQGFHMTLATVDQSVFPVQAALNEINKVILPGKWHRTPVVVHRPVCRRCDRLISAMKV